MMLALSGTMLVSCTQSEYVGDMTAEKATSEAIGFGGGFKAITRDTYGADAAGMLNKKFIVTGVKGDGTGKDQADVFKSYAVEWTANSAGTTESNTADWEYVGKENSFGITAQSIKYWDFATTAYDFAAYSIGTGNATGTAISYNATEITDGGTGTGKYKIDAAYTLSGTRADLEKCYITDMKTVKAANYKEEVQLQFRALATKVRVALYETVPGYKVKDVFFYQDATTARNTDISANTSATLFGGDATTGAFLGEGTYTVSFPKIGSGNATDPDYNKAHVAFTPKTGSSEATSTTQAFGTLNYASGYLKTTSKDPSFAGTGTYYQTVLPNEEGVTLELRVNYTLVSEDGSGETITVYGARAFIPANFTKWLSNYAYTYIFKISDNSNGWTNPDPSSTDPEGLFPITFDAVVLDDQTTGTQTTITTVATPSITTYQKGHVYSASDEYVAGDIYVQAQSEGALITDLNATGKTFLYTLTGVTNPTEALVMDALNIRASEASGVITGRNSLVLTPETTTFDATITAIPGEDGNDIAVTAGKAAMFTAEAGKTYAFVYQVSTGTATPIVTTLADPSAEPSDWASGTYFTDAACTTAATTFTAGTTYYQKKYVNLNNVYGVKVIKVQ
ncbi:MAG: hypothetical protein K6A96_00015 [Prevotella sp.]|nr:hypothetical protein [Prevotella sp.]